MKDKKKVDIQIDKVGGGVVDGEEALGFVGLLDDGVDVVDIGDGFQNLLLLILVETALFFGLLDHLVVMLHQGPTQPSFLVLSHGCSEAKQSHGNLKTKTLERAESRRVFVVVD